MYLAKNPDQRPTSAAAVAEELVGIDPAARSHPKPHGDVLPAISRPRRNGNFLAAAICICALAAAPWWAPPVYRFATNQGLLVIQTDDPSIEVNVSRGGDKVDVIDRETGNALTLEAGSYDVSLVNARNDVRLEKDTVTLTRGGRQVVRIVRGGDGVSAWAAKPQAAEAEHRVGYIRRFLGHTEFIGSVALSADGKRALTGSSDKTARLWDVATGREIQRFLGHTGGVTQGDCTITYVPSRTFSR